MSLLQKFVPDQWAQSVLEIDFDGLRELGKSKLIIDVDYTLLPCLAEEVSQAILGHLKKSVEAGFEIVLLSNASFRKKRVKNIAKQVGASSFVCCNILGQKPKRKGFLDAMKEIEATPETAVVIGDNILTDIRGGKNLGIFTILVDPIGSDVWLSYITGARFIELGLRIFLRRKLERQVVD